MASGFTDAAEITFKFSPVQDPTGPNPTDSMTITGPFGQQLTVTLLEPGLTPAGQEHPLPMMLESRPAG